jgi:hypothetical protein
MLGEVTLRASLCTALAVLGAVGAVAAGSLTASASADAVPIPADTFDVVSAGASATNLDQLTVVVDSTSTVATLSAQFLTNGVDAYDQTLTLASTAADPTGPTGSTQTTWTANLPAGASGLPLGAYSVTLNGSFTDSGTTHSQPDAGVFSFFATSALTLAAAQANLSYPHPSTVLSGQVTLTNPDGTPDTGYSSSNDLWVRIQVVGGAFNELLPISSDGTFSDLDFTPSASESVVAEVVGAVVDSSESAPVALTVASVKPTLSLRVNPVTETYGKPVTVTGTLSGTSGSTSAPVAGRPVWVSTSTSSARALAKGTTAANGGFSVTLPERAAGGTLYVGSDSATDLAAAVVPLTLKVVHPTQISSFKVSLSQYWEVGLSGCLGFPASDKSERIDHTSGLTVQYASPGGSWKKLGVINGNESDQGCGTGGIKFSGSFAAPENYAYYRVVYAGATGATSYAARTGSAVLAWRYADRITDFKVSPTVVNAGGKLTIKGTLQYYYSGWHNYGGQTIVVSLHPKSGNSKWYWLVKVKTNSKGQFSTTFKDPVSATWQAAFDGNNSNGVGHLAVGSAEVYVRLK